MSETVLVTGAAGFLGSHICEYFGQRGYSIVAVGRVADIPLMSNVYPNLQRFCEVDLPDDTFVEILKESQPTKIIHCAGSASVPSSMREPYEDFRQSAWITAFVLEMIRKHVPSCHFIFLSSAAVYGNPIVLPIKEDSLCQPISPYGYHKFICELLCQEYQSAYKIKCSVLRIFSAYGERLRKQVIYDLCRKFSDDSSHFVEVYGTGDETRDFVHAIDVARTVELICTRGVTGTFNVASGCQTKISDLAEIIKDCLKSSKNIVYSGSPRLGDPLHWQADISKLISLGYHPTVSIQEGLRNYCNWFKSEYIGIDDK